MSVRSSSRPSFGDSGIIPYTERIDVKHHVELIPNWNEMGPNVNIMTGAYKGNTTDIALMLEGNWGAAEIRLTVDEAVRIAEALFKANTRQGFRLGSKKYG